MTTGNVQITAGSGTPIRVVTNSGVDSGADQQIVSLADGNGNLALAGPDGTLQVDEGASSLAFDAFDGTLANQWTVGGTAVPTQASGALTFNAGTTASATSYITSNNPLMMNAESYLHAGFVLSFDTNAALTNSTRWWGYGQNQASPTAAAPVLNGAVFMLDYSAGAYYAAVYSNGTRTQTVALTKPTDGINHRFQIQFRTTRVYFIIDGSTVATITNPNPVASNNLFLIAGQANNTTGPSSAGTLVISVASAADGASNNIQLSDGLYPSIRASIKKSPTTATNQVATTDNALLVSALPPVSQAATTLGTAATAVTLTLAAPGAGLRHYITGIWFERYISTATTGAASGYATTATNTGLVFLLPSDTQSIGTVTFPVAITFSSPVATTAQNTATTFTAPAATGTVYRISATYFIAP